MFAAHPCLKGAACSLMSMLEVPADSSVNSSCRMTGTVNHSWCENYLFREAWECDPQTTHEMLCSSSYAAARKLYSRKSEALVPLMIQRVNRLIKNAGLLLQSNSCREKWLRTNGRKLILRMKLATRGKPGKVDSVTQRDEQENSLAVCITISHSYVMSGALAKQGSCVFLDSRM